MEEKKYCYKYPHPAVTTDCVIFSYDEMKLKVLLIERGGEPYKGRWAFPGGFLNMDETAEEGARRELKEETGLSAGYIEQFHCYTDPRRDPRERVISIAFFALMRKTYVHGGDDAAKAQWFALDEVPPLAFDHDLILRQALARLRERIHFRPVGFDLLPEKFTLNELQKLYEAILGESLDHHHFTEKMLHLGVLNRLDSAVLPAHDDESALYCFNKDKYDELKRNDFKLEF